jgi:hypothetical protein
MSPQAFSFRLTVPNDPDGATVVAIVAAHAAHYAGLDAETGAAFAERTRAAAAQVLKHGAGTGSLMVIAAANGQLTATIGAQSVSHVLPS